MNTEMEMPVVVEGGGIRDIDPMGVLPSHDVREMSGAEAEASLPDFRFSGAGWYMYGDMAILAAPTPRRSEDGHQAYLFICFDGATGRDAIRWAASMPVRAQTAAPEAEPAAEPGEGDLASVWPAADEPEPPPASVARARRA